MGHNVLKEENKMTDYNKLLWFLFILAINGLISMGIKHTKSKVFDIIYTILFVVILLAVSICWAYLDFWK